MQNVVPVALQRLRAADIMQMAGLMNASLGQEYCRLGLLRETRRQGARLSGRVDVSPGLGAQVGMSGVDEENGKLEVGESGGKVRRYQVEVEVKSATSCTGTCQCGKSVCPHAAALLYQWLAHPTAFSVVEPPSTPADVSVSDQSAPTSVSLTTAEPAVSDGAPPRLAQDATSDASAKSTRPSADAVPAPAVAGFITRNVSAPVPLSDLQSILTQQGLSELRGIAREYELATGGVGKQQLAELILEKLRQPEAVRRVATTLEKHQRQLLAAVALAGGSITDEDLRGLFERFSLGQSAQLQGILLTLQGKALLFRTSLNSTQPRMGLSGSLLDIGWYVPQEVRAALRVTMPATPFDVESGDDKDGAPTQRLAEPFALLADLLLVAHALNRYRLTTEAAWAEPVISTTTAARTVEYSPMRTLSSTDGSVAIPPPPDMPPASLLSVLREDITGAPAFLRFVVRLLRQADVLYKDEDATGAPCLRALPGAAQLLLGPGRTEVLRDLFEMWLTQSSYGELYELQEQQIRLRCRSSSLNMPILRSGELEAENGEARQMIVSLLAQAPLYQWISFSAFARFVYRLNPLFLQRRQRLYATPHWWMEQEAGRPLRPLQLQDWGRAEYHYLSYLLSGPLHWWGICDTALADDGRLLAFRLTSTAAWLLTGAQPDLVSVPGDTALEGTLEVLENAELLVPSAVTAWAAIDILEAFAEPAGVHNDRLRYRLTPRALGEALSRGARPAALLDLLREIARASASQQRAIIDTLVERLERWIASYGHVRIYSGVTLLEVADNAVLRELTTTGSLAGQVVQNISANMYIVRKTVTERLTEDLKRRSQAPLVHDEDNYGPE